LDIRSGEELEDIINMMADLVNDLDELFEKQESDWK